MGFKLKPSILLGCVYSNDIYTKKIKYILIAAFNKNRCAEYIIGMIYLKRKYLKKKYWSRLAIINRFC